MPSLRLLCGWAGLTLTLLTLGRLAGADDPKPGMPPVGPLSPKDELATFRVPKGFRVELVASEPDIVDPVAIAFDEDGRLFVAEMRGYPNDGVGTDPKAGPITSGKIKLLEDPDEKGTYRKCTTFADGLRFPTSLMPYKGGLLVTVAPDLIYIDAKGQRRTLYSGFGTGNIQGMVNGLQWGLDNWVYACGGTNPSTVRSEEKKDAPPIELRGRGFRFHPEVPGSLEPTSGGGQYGLCADDWQRWFTATNSQHLRHIVLPDHYLRRNPHLPVSAVTLDVPDGVDGHGAVCKVHRISPFEAWRVERTTMRKDGPDSKRFPPTELVPGGYITSACSPLIYTADLFPKEYGGNSFVCEPANNLVHRDLLEPKGATFTAKRADADCEFLASTDIWFRPVNLSLGPDGAIYVVDFYREVIETPLSLTPELKAKLPLHSQGRGRIWRIVPEGAPAFKKPALSKATTEELVKHLSDANPWKRLTAQRLLIERKDKSAQNPLESLIQDRKKQSDKQSPQSVAHALWTLRGLGFSADQDIEDALADPSPEVREQALRVAESMFPRSAGVTAGVLNIVKDNSPRVRFQAAFTIGEFDFTDPSFTLAQMLRRDVDDPWMQIAVLSSSARAAPMMLKHLLTDERFVKDNTPARQQAITRLALIVGARGKEAGIGQVLKLLAEEERANGWQGAVLEGLGQGQQLAGKSLRKLWQEPPAELKDSVERVQPFFKRAATTAQDEKRPVAERLAAVRLLSFGPFAVAGPPLQELLSPTAPGDLQRAAVRALALQEDPKVAAALLSQWSGQGPEVRAEVLEALFARADRLKVLLDGIEQKKVLAAQLPLARVEQLRIHRDPELRKRAVALLASRAAPARQKVIDEYKPALDLKADAMRGKVVFKNVCSTCHRLENEGKQVGPDLLSALRTKTPDALLIDILDPSREVDPRYVNYTVETKSGKVLTGIIVTEGPTSLTLRRAGGEQDEVLRSEILKDGIVATGKSLMPEELEKQLKQQDVADVIAYLRGVAGLK